ncbi:MAG: hypothetical protein IT365_13030 [Candidatus Hydrogenedentes bacterium]|nr:hypothetical protein [Candidatus Hydrogenedentota bacterium]
MSTPAEPATPPKHRRRLRWVLRGAAVILVLAGVLASGVPQRKAFEYGLSKALNGYVRIEGLSLFPPARIATLRVASDAKAARQGEEMLHVEGLTVEYRLARRGWVRFPRVSVDRVDIRLLDTGVAPANFDFLFTRPARQEPRDPYEGMDAVAYIPGAVQVREITIDVETPRGSGRVEGMAFDWETDTSQHTTARLSGESLEGTFRAASRPTAIAFREGSIDVTLHRDDVALSGTLQAHLPGCLELKGDVAAMALLGTMAGRINLETCRVGGAVSPLLPAPVVFDEVDVSGTTLDGSRGPGGAWSVSGNVQAKAAALRAGPPGHEYYDGGLQVSGAFEGQSGTFELVLNSGQRMSVVAEHSPEKSRAVATLIDWTREGLRDALPKDWRPLLDEVPHLMQVAGTAEVNYEHPGYSVAVSIDPVFSPDAARSERFTVEISGDGSLNRAEASLFQGTLLAALGSGEVNASLDVASLERFEADFELGDLDVSRWATPLETRIPIPLPEGILSGTVQAGRGDGFHAKAHLNLETADDGPRVVLDLDAKGLADEAPLRVLGQATLGASETPSSLTFDVALAQPRWTPSGTVTFSALDVARVEKLFKLALLPEGGVAVVTGNVGVEASGKGTALRVEVAATPMSLYGLNVPTETPLSAKGTLTLSDDFSILRAETLNFTLTDDAHLDLTGLELRLSPFSASGRVAGKIDFDYVAPILGLESIVGALIIDAPLRYDKGLAEGSFRLEGDGFGYGRWAGPYGTPVLAEGNLVFDTAKAKGTIEQLHVAWGDGTQANGTPFDFGITPIAFNGPVSIETDLAPLVDLRFLDSAEGKASVSGTLGYGDGVPKAGVHVDLAANSFILSGAAAALAGLSAAGSIYYEDSLSGNLQFAAASAAAAGAELEQPRGICAIENGVAKVSGAEASLYGGQLTINGEVNLLDTNAGGRVEARFTGIDLDRFTKEYEPPSVRLTGLADGTVLLVWNQDGLQDLRVDLASNQDFSLNREVIESLLLQSLTSGVTGLKMLNRRIQKKTIGEEAMREFDNATASLSLEGERYEEQRLVGPVALKSETLDFSIDVAVDLRAIADALEIQQQAKLEEGDTISAEPVQWTGPEQEGPSSDE